MLICSKGCEALDKATVKAEFNRKSSCQWLNHAKPLDSSGISLYGV